MPQAESGAERRVRVLLSTFNGARFLPEQLASLVAQDFPAWTLHWRDDGSKDATPALLRAFADRRGNCVEHAHPAGNLGVLASYMRLLRDAAPALGEADSIAFADQDDVWLPEKLSRGVAALAGVAGPALYCARYTRVDAALNRLGESARLTGPTAFPAALTQNVATGCTILLNRQAASLVAASTPPPGTVHDWWCYLLVTAAGGRVLRDERPGLLYRQHASNSIGAPPNAAARAIAAWRRGSRPFMALLRAHVQALLARPALLSPQARGTLARLDVALQRPGPWRRLPVLATADLRRQTWWETAAFRLWFLFG